MRAQVEGQVGRRALWLDPDPAIAPHVAWMFAQRLAGASITAIARELNERVCRARRGGRRT